MANKILAVSRAVRNRTWAKRTDATYCGIDYTKIMGAAGYWFFIVYAYSQSKHDYPSCLTPVYPACAARVTVDRLPNPAVAHDRANR